MLLSTKKDNRPPGFAFASVTFDSDRTTMSRYEQPSEGLGTTVARYYFDVDDGALNTDDVGAELPGADAALAEARRAICEMARDLSRKMRPIRLGIHVRDETGKRAMSVTLTVAELKD
jgi:hypothetical protein